MKITRRELELIVENYLKDDLQEGTFGAVGGGVNITFCDLSRIPELFHTLFSAIRDKRYDKIEARLNKELELAAPAEQESVREKLGPKLEKLSTPGFLESISSHRAFKGLVDLMGPGLTILTLKGAADCEYIVASAENLLINVISPIFGLDVERIKTSSAKHRERYEKEQAVANSKSGVTPTAVATFFSSALATRSIINTRDRKKIPQKHLAGGEITQFHLDLFELMAPQEYQDFIDDPSEDIPKSAKEKFVLSLETLEKVHSNSIRDWEDGFLLATPGTLQDQKIKRIFRNMKPSFEDTFETPKEATAFVRKCYQELVKELPFEGFRVFDSI